MIDRKELRSEARAYAAAMIRQALSTDEDLEDKELIKEIQKVADRLDRGTR